MLFCFCIYCRCPLVLFCLGCRTTELDYKGLLNRKKEIHTERERERERERESKKTKKLVTNESDISFHRLRFQNICLVSKQ